MFLGILSTVSLTVRIRHHTGPLSVSQHCISCTSCLSVPVIHRQGRTSVYHSQDTPLSMVRAPVSHRKGRTSVYHSLDTHSMVSLELLSSVKTEVCRSFLSVLVTGKAWVLHWIVTLTLSIECSVWIFLILALILSITREMLFKSQSPGYLVILLVPKSFFYVILLPFSFSFFGDIPWVHSFCCCLPSSLAGCFLKWSISKPSQATFQGDWLL